MYFTDVFIRRPVFASVLSLIILLVGYRSFQALSLRQYPNIEPSVISVNVGYPGASAKLIEGFITTPLENSLGAIDGVDFMTSNSNINTATITLHFKLGYDINTAMADVSNAVSSARYELPPDINDPIITKVDPDANPTVFVAFQSNTMDAQAMTDYVLRVIQPQIQLIPGVSQARIFGNRTYAMRIWLDPERMAAHSVTGGDIAQALRDNNVQAAPGLLEAPYQELNIEAATDLTTANEFNNLVIRNNNGVLTRIKDVGNAELGAEDDRASVDISGAKNAIVMGIIPQSAGNPLEVSKQVHALVPSLEANAPAGLKISILYDSSKFIASSLHEVRKTIFEATFCVALVMFLFLGSLRAITIPLVTIPLSLIGVCLFMLILGYTLNTLTLLAWILAIGLVVDDSIVVVENIHRHIEAGEQPVIAAIKGTREIGFAVIAMTFTLAAVYAPIGFLHDITGRLFREFAFTLAGSVIVSGFIALTLSPMMSSKLLRHEDLNKKGLPAKIDVLFDNIMAKYKNLLTKSLQKRKLVLIIAGIVYLSCYILYATLPHELAPSEDQGYLLGIVMGPTTANLNYTEKYSSKLAAIYKSIPEMENYGIINGIPNGVNSALSFLVLKPWNERSKTSDQIVQELFPQFWQITGVRAFPVNPPPLPGSNSNTPVSFVLKTTGSYEELNTSAQTMLAAMHKNPHFQNADSNLKFDKPQIDVTVDRSKANQLGISMADIASGLNIMLGQPTATHFEMRGRAYDVIPELAAEYRSAPDQMNEINVRTASGQLIPLSNVIQISESASPQELPHFQQLRSATLTASLTPGYTLGQALNYLEVTAKQQLPSDTQYDFSGQSRQFMEASGGIMGTFYFALVFIFLILAAQFESFRDPLIVMISVPLSLTGALLTIHLTGGTLNIYTQIGLITLIGLISKHGILMVEFANQLQEKGLVKSAAIIEAATLRLRPILMTTGAMLLGAIPLALATGAGANSRQQLGWTVFGGMAFGTLLTLFVVPTVYMLLATRKVAVTESV